jgi:hypothetical protein
MAIFGPDSSTVQAFYVVGAIFVIITGAIMGYFILQPILEDDGPNILKIYNNGYVWNITFEEDVADCSFGVRNCTNCESTYVENKMGCCSGCKNPNSCNVHIGVQWMNVPPRIRQQRIWLLATADCDSWWQTGWAPYLVTWRPGKPKKKKNDTEDATEEEDEDEKTIDARGFRSSDLYGGPNGDDYLYYDDEATGALAERAISDTLYFDINNTIPGYSSGYATVTNGCFGDPYRQLAVVGCLTDMDDKHFQGQKFDSIPWEKCISVYGTCLNLDYVFVRGAHLPPPATRFAFVLAPPHRDGTTLRFLS